MKQYNNIQSTIRPKNIDVRPEKVYINLNVHEVSQTFDDEETTMYEYDSIEYTKDEYIALQYKQNDETQSALAEIYEIIGG